MNAQKTGRIFTAAALMVLAGTASACRAASPALIVKKQAAVLTTTDAPSKMTPPQLPVVVQIGDAMLEEYAGGDPAGRTQLFRGGSAAQAASAKRSGPNHSYHS